MENNENIEEQNTEETKMDEQQTENASAENQNAETEQKEEEQNEADAEVDETERLRQKMAEMSDSYLRLRAEFDNYKKRTIKEKADLIKSAGEGVFLNIIPLVDDFERGLQAAEKATEIDSMKEGMSLIYGKFVKFLEQNGVKEIDTKDKKFDTDYHEAITAIPAASEEQKGMVVDCVQKGYTLNDKVIRFAKVVVAQ